MKVTYLSRFTPSLMTPEALENIFVQRHKLAQQLVELIRESATTPSKHYTLLIGPRGIGKTHFISLVYHRIRKMDDLQNRLLIAWLREDEWGVTSFLDLLLRIFRALHKEYEDAQLVERVESLYELPAEDAERVAAALLKEVIGNRTLLLLMENLDEVFAGLDDEGQKQLRAYLQENAFCTILATAQSLFNGVKLQTSPFYGFFRVRYLKALTLDEAVQLLTNVAKLEGDRDLESFIQTPTGRDRIEAVHYLSGGSPRVYIIFSAFLTRKSLDELVEAFMAMLDDLTPYYQERMKCLSPQQRKIVDVLCDRRQAVTVKEIAQRCFITHQTTSSQLKKLLEMGYVSSEPVGRESYYEIREPLMRFCLEVKKQRGEPIRLFVDFLRLWYTQTELERRLEMLSADAVLERQYVLLALQAIEAERENQCVAGYVNEYKAHVERKDLTKALQVAEKLVAIRGDIEDLFVQGFCEFLLKYHNKALMSFDKVIELHPDNVEAWGFRGVTLNVLGRYDQALASFNKVLELDPHNSQAQRDRNEVLVKQLIELASKYAPVWISRGVALGQLERYDQALASYDQAIKLAPKYAPAWRYRGWVLSKLERYDEALASWDKAIALGDQSSFVFFSRAELLLPLNRWDEGIAALGDALNRFAHADEPDTGDTKAIIRNFFNSTHDAAIWRSRITTLVELYKKHEVLPPLGKGLVESIPAFMSEMVSDKAARTWLEVWRELTSDCKEFQIPLRLLNAAVRYRETKGDPRVLLELPIEERNLLKQVLKIDEQ
ncbi:MULTISPECIES: tetratricopeptide repeat protein [Cyanophyceae]|uniref:tetratricopeptide repeat protein n=1 Tax=Cyanophyceae TaxID=3028117 RepID=UPI0018F0368F|nr:tetratricopeptide repeat protein [Trichocoleus sp. FACHB-69]